MARYRWNGVGFVDRQTGEPMLIRDPNAVCAPMVMRDVPEYRSPIDGTLITSRSHQREDLKRHDCVIVDPPRRPRGYRNPRFAAKHGLTLTES
jgi:hypothetical protein